MVYKNNKMKIINYTDYNLTALKILLKSIDYELDNLISKKTKLEELISDFQLVHTRELGQITLELLQLRKLKFKNNSFKYKRAEEDEQTYKKQIIEEEEKKKHKISESEKYKLKKMYRKACLLCHPDKFENEHKDIAQNLFIQLKQSYEENNLVQVEKILENLENGVLDNEYKKQNEVEKVKFEIEKKQIIVAKLKSEITELESGKLMKIIKNKENWNIYFSQLKKDLEREVEYLRNQTKI